MTRAHATGEVRPGHTYMLEAAAHGDMAILTERFPGIEYWLEEAPIEWGHIAMDDEPKRVWITEG